MREKLLFLNVLALSLTAASLLLCLIGKTDVVSDGTLLAEARELREISVNAERYNDALNNLLTSAQSRLDRAKYLVNILLFVGFLDVTALSLNYVHIRRRQACGAK